MRYLSSHLLQSVCQALEYVVVQAKASSEEDDSILRSLIYVHMAYQKLAPRLKYFRAMNAVWPQCSSMIMDLKQKDPKNEMFSEEKFVCLFSICYSCSCHFINIHWDHMCAISLYYAYRTYRLDMYFSRTL